MCAVFLLFIVFHLYARLSIATVLIGIGKVSFCHMIKFFWKPCCRNGTSHVARIFLEVFFSESTLVALKWLLAIPLDTTLLHKADALSSSKTLYKNNQYIISPFSVSLHVFCLTSLVVSNRQSNDIVTSWDTRGRQSTPCALCLLPAFVCFSHHFLFPPSHQ